MADAGDHRRASCPARRRASFASVSADSRSLLAPRMTSSGFCASAANSGHMSTCGVGPAVLNGSAIAMVVVEARSRHCPRGNCAWPSAPSRRGCNSRTPGRVARDGLGRFVPAVERGSVADIGFDAVDAGCRRCPGPMSLRIAAAIRCGRQRGDGHGDEAAERRADEDRLRDGQLVEQLDHVARRRSAGCSAPGPGRIRSAPRPRNSSASTRKRGE